MTTTPPATWVTDYPPQPTIIVVNGHAVSVTREHVWCISCSLGTGESDPRMQLLLLALHVDYRGDLKTAYFLATLAGDLCSGVRAMAEQQEAAR